MKILFTLHNIAYKGGGERVVANIANELCKIPNYEITIMSYYKETSDVSCAYLLDPRIQVSYLHDFPDCHEHERGFKRVLWRLSRHFLINLRINRAFSDYDIIIESHLSMFYPRFKTPGTKYIKIMHMVINKWKTKNKFYDRIVFLNERELERWRPYGNNVIKIPNFLPSLPFEDLLEEALCANNQENNKIENMKDCAQFDGANLSSKTISHFDAVEQNNKLLVYEKLCDFISARNLLCAYKNKASDIHNINTESQQYNIMLAVGRMEPISNHKGFPRLIEAYSKVAREFPNWRLEIIGDDCGQKEILQQMIDERNMQDFILLRDFTPEIDKEYLRASIYVMSSHSESLPMVLIEAASYGLPLLAYDIVTIRDCFRDNGILVPDNDEEAFCNGMRELMENEQKRLIMGQNGIRLVKEQFSKASIMKQWLDLFDELHPRNALL